MKLQYTIGETVYDSLTRSEAKIIGIQFAIGKVYEGDKQKEYIGSTGYWLDNDFLSGGRHPWEIEPVGRWKLFIKYLPLTWSNFKAKIRNLASFWEEDEMGRYR